MSIVTQVSKIKLIEGYHLTAIERKGIRTLLNEIGDRLREREDANFYRIGRGKKHYQITYLGDNQYKVVIKYNESDECGRMCVRSWKNTIKVS